MCIRDRLITARNKMRSATSVSRPITVSGRMIETPRLKGDKATVVENEALCRSFLKSLATDEHVESCLLYTSRCV